MKTLKKKKKDNPKVEKSLTRKQFLNSCDIEMLNHHHDYNKVTLFLKVLFRWENNSFNAVLPMYVLYNTASVVFHSDFFIALLFGKFAESGLSTDTNKYASLRACLPQEPVLKYTTLIYTMLTRCTLIMFKWGL